MLAAVLRDRFLVALIVVAAAARAISLTWLHPVTWDEIEFFRATDWVRQGLVPYRDFWEHHTPLQWFFFAPVTALTRSPGVAAVILMRWAQIPLWILTFWLLARWMRDAGISLAARLSVILLALCSSMFMLAAVEYRIDTVGCALYVLALVLLPRVHQSAWFGFAAGAALCLAGFANLRLGPLLALTVLFARIVRPRERAWGGSASANSLFAGVGVTFAVCSMYFLVTHSASIAFQRVWTENYLGDRLSEGTEWVLLHRLAVPFGFRPLDRTQGLFEPASLDVATALILVTGMIGVVRVLRANRRAPDHLFFLAFLQVGSLLFVAAMKFIYHYHFEIVVLLMLPFVAAELDRFLQAADRRAIVAALLLIVSATNIFASVFRGKELDMAYEDLIMREVDDRTPPRSKVFDGVGWALRRTPAYPYWFLPMLVQSLEAKGILEPYTQQQLADDPPAAIISDYRIYLWLKARPALAAFATAHYLPTWRNLWLPGMSARLTPANQAAEWIVPTGGAYRVYASEPLSIHPWFRDPVTFGTFESPVVEISLVGFPPVSRLPLAFWTDGVAVPPADVLHLRRKQRLRVVSLARTSLGIMIVPANTRELFRQPAHGVTIDGAAPAITHIPAFPNVFR
jgi:hypothetical protein